MAVAFRGFGSSPQLISGPVTGDPASVSAASVGTVSLTVPGALPDMHFIVTAPSLSANLAIGGSYCTTAGTVVVRLVNPTASPVDDASQSFYVIGL